MNPKLVLFLFFVLTLKNISCNKPNDSLYKKNCKELLDADDTSTSGIYTIQPNQNVEPFMVLCDMELNGGGWTTIHKRFDGSQNFNRNWTDYKHGFGNLHTEFWLGLEYVYQLTGYHLNELIIELIDADDNIAYAQYELFSIGSELTDYSIKLLGEYNNGTAGDSFSQHGGLKFSTSDRVIELNPWAVNDVACAVSYNGGWWYDDCFFSNLNNNEYFVGTLNKADQLKGMIWIEFRGKAYGLKAARMLVRPVTYKQ